MPRGGVLGPPKARPWPQVPVLQALIDADNVAPRRVQPVVDLLSGVIGDVRLIARGAPAALARLRLPPDADTESSTGWQRADLALAEAYRPSAGPLLLVTGDGDFALLATRHPGPVLVVSGAPSSRLREVPVLDPALDGMAAIGAWLTAHGYPPTPRPDP